MVTNVKEQEQLVVTVGKVHCKTHGSAERVIVPASQHRGVRIPVLQRRMLRLREAQQCEGVCTGSSESLVRI